MKRSSFLASAVLAQTAFCQEILYEGDVFPESVGWERLGTEDADRWLDQGWLHHSVDEGVWPPCNICEIDFYQQPLAELAGTCPGGIILEWVVETDVPSALLDESGIATVVSAWGTGAALYHFTITDERVQFLRDTIIPLIFVDISPSTAHVYRLELCNQPFCEENLYAFYLDNELIDSGVAQARYPNPDSNLIWGTRHNVYPNTVRWDFVRVQCLPGQPVPAASSWGLAVLALALITAGTLVLRRLYHRSSPVSGA